MIPLQLRTKLLTTINACMSLADLQQFTIINKEIFGVSFDESVAAVIALYKGFEQYIDRLEEFGTTFYFIRLVCDQYPQHVLSVDLKKEFYKVYEDTSQGGTKIRGEFLDSIMVENNSLPFIGRNNIKDSLHKMLNNEQPRICFIKGTHRMGRSYVQHYLSEIAGKTQRYELVPIDLAVVHSEYAQAGESLWGSHVAAYIAGSLGLPGTVNADAKELFKHTPFIGQLKNYIRESKRICLFFFDQFEAITPAMDLSPLIMGIANLSIEATGTECFSFLSGPGETELARIMIPFRLKGVLGDPRHTLELDNFDAQQVEVFFKKVYLYMSTAFNVQDDMNTFMANVNSQLLPASTYAPPNVERIGKTVSTWLQNQY